MIISILLICISIFRECGETFASVEGLALHLRLHFGDHSFLADICSLAASLKHTAVNVAASFKKTHICSDCGRGFTQRHGLFQHRQRYANGSCKEKPFACEKCGKSFAQKNHLTLHERQHMDLTRNSPMSRKVPQSSSEDSCMDDQQIEPSTADNNRRNAQNEDRTLMLLHHNHSDLQRVNLLNRHTPDTSTSENGQRSRNDDRKEMEQIMARSMMLQQNHPDHKRVDLLRRQAQDSNTSENSPRTSQGESQKVKERGMTNTMLLHQNHQNLQRLDLLNRHNASTSENSQQSSQSENQKEIDQVMANSMMLQQGQRVEVINRHSQDSTTIESNQRTSRSENRKDLELSMTDSLVIQQTHLDNQTVDLLVQNNSDSVRSLNTPVPVALIRSRNNTSGSQGNLQQSSSNQHHHMGLTADQNMPCLNPVANKQY